MRVFPDMSVRFVANKNSLAKMYQYLAKEYDFETDVEHEKPAATPC